MFPERCNNHLHLFSSFTMAKYPNAFCMRMNKLNTNFKILNILPQIFWKHWKLYPELLLVSPWQAKICSSIEIELIFNSGSMCPGTKVPNFLAAHCCRHSNAPMLESSSGTQSPPVPQSGNLQLKLIQGQWSSPTRLDVDTTSVWEREWARFHLLTFICSFKHI